MSKSPPKYWLRFFRWFCNPDFAEDIEGDLMERFEKRLQTGKAARLLFARDVMQLFRPGLIKNLEGTQKLNYYGMIKHNMKVGWRNIQHNKTFSLINILGLSSGVAVCLVALIFYRYESNFDRHHKQADHTYRVTQHTQRTDSEHFWGTTAYPLAAALRSDFPEFSKVTQVAGPMNRLFSIEKPEGETVRFEEPHVLFVDDHYPEVFDLEWLAGDPKSALDLLNAAVITESVAKKCFGESFNPSEAMGKTLLLNNKDPLIITGVIGNPPPTVNLKSGMLISYQFFKKHNPYPTGNWSGNYQGTAFVVLEQNTDPLKVAAEINDWKSKYLNEQDDQQITYNLQPLTEIHNETLYGAVPQGYQISGRILNTLLVVAAFILIIAITNFINLVTARATLRSREVGVRKIIGGGRKVILAQFLFENGMLVSIALGIGIVLSHLLVDQVNLFLSIIDMNLAFQWTDVYLIVPLCFLVILLSGFYPAIVLSSFTPLKALTSKGLSLRPKHLGFRRGMTFFQFMLVQIFVMAALIIGAQLSYFSSKELGFQSDLVVTVPVPSHDKIEVLKHELMVDNQIRNVSVGSGPPMGVEGFSLGTTFRFPHQDKLEGKSAEMKIIDSTYLDFYGLKLLAGRSFSENKPRFDEFIVNRKLVKSMGWEPNEAIGEKLRINEGEAVIVGVVEDFHNHSLQNDITPVVLMNWSSFQWSAFVKVSSFESLVHIEETWKSLFPASIFSYRFLEDSMEREYVVEKLIFTGFKLFSVLVIIIGCLGLFGLVSFISLQRTKEVGIRKVLGAGTHQILSLLTREFLLLILMAFVVATPVVWYFMEQWLETFTYSIPLSPWIFIAGGLITLVLGSSVSMVKSYRAASMNPVDSLRNE